MNVSIKGVMRPMCPFKQILKSKETEEASLYRIIVCEGEATLKTTL